MKSDTDEYHKWVQMLKQQITLLNNKQQQVIYMQETYKKCWRDIKN